MQEGDEEPSVDEQSSQVGFWMIRALVLIVLVYLLIPLGHDGWVLVNGGDDFWTKWWLDWMGFPDWYIPGGLPSYY